MPVVNGHVLRKAGGNPTPDDGTEIRAAEQRLRYNLSRSNQVLMNARSQKLEFQSLASMSAPSSMVKVLLRITGVGIGREDQSNKIVQYSGEQVTVALLLSAKEANSIQLPPNGVEAAEDFA
jgi:hypothetical protein